MKLKNIFYTVVIFGLFYVVLTGFKDRAVWESLFMISLPIAMFVDIVRRDIQLNKAKDANKHIS